MAWMKPEDIERYLSLPINAVLATTMRSGRAYQAPVWFLWKDGVFWLTGTYQRTWCKHIFKDPRVSVCVEGPGPVPGYIAVQCSATPVDEDIWPISAALAQKYVGARPGATDADVERFVANMRTEPRLLFRLTPEKWRAIDLTVYTGARGDKAWQREQADG